MTQSRVSHIAGLEHVAAAGVAHVLIRESSGAVEVVHAFGDLDLSNAPELEAKLWMLAHQAHEPIVVLDLGACNYLDSTILTVLVRASRDLESRFVVVVPPRNAIRRMFQISGLDVHLGICDSMLDASTRLQFELPHL